MASVLKNATCALNKFGHSDRINAPRVLKLIEPTGLSIAVSTGLSERSECVGALFKLLGSDAFRKDEEIGLVIGEALALFAGACDTTETDSSSKIDTGNWPLGMDEIFGRSVSPPAQVSLTMTEMVETNDEKFKNQPCVLHLSIYKGCLYFAPNSKIHLQQS
jgi:proteasome component ECM29